MYFLLLYLFFFLPVRFQTAVLESEIIAIGEAFTTVFSIIQYSEKIVDYEFLM
jgi:hypothetical protein